MKYSSLTRTPPFFPSIYQRKFLLAPVADYARVHLRIFGSGSLESFLQHQWVQVLLLWYKISVFNDVVACVLPFGGFLCNYWIIPGVYNWTLGTSLRFRVSVYLRIWEFLMYSSDYHYSLRFAHGVIKSLCSIGTS